MVCLAAILFLAACNGGGESTPIVKTDTNTTGRPAEAVVDSEAASANKKEYRHESHPGYAILLKQDCSTCHQPEKQVIGPSFMMIADRYDSTKKGTLAYLANKIIKGGTGNWGQVPMTGHNKLSQADAELLVKYILTFKQK